MEHCLHCIMIRSQNRLMDTIVPLSLQPLCMPWNLCMHFWRAADLRIIIHYMLSSTAQDTAATSGPGRDDCRCSHRHWTTSQHFYTVVKSCAVKSAKCLRLLPVVLVLRIWSCLHHWLLKQHLANDNVSDGQSEDNIALCMHIMMTCNENKRIPKVTSTSCNCIWTING